MNARPIPLAFGVLLSLALLACGGPEDTSARTTGPTRIEIEVGIEGGLVEIPGVILEIPENALAGNLTIGIERIPARASHWGTDGDGFTLESDEFIFTPDGLVFQKPVRITFDPDLVFSDDAVLLWSDADAPGGLAVLDVTSGGMGYSASISHFSSAFFAKIAEIVGSRCKRMGYGRNGERCCYNFICGPKLECVRRETAFGICRPNCKPDETRCGDNSCVNTNTDDQNCGGCGEAGEDCTELVGGKCIEGRCERCGGYPMSSKRWCPSKEPPNFVCSDTDRDEQNCGGCGDMCPGTCRNGICCGNIHTELGETCDGPDCPTSCPHDGDLCTAEVLTGDPKTCDVACKTVEITDCAPGDGCCPANCDASNDADCTGGTGGTGGSGGNQSGVQCGPDFCPDGPTECGKWPTEYIVWGWKARCINSLTGGCSLSYGQVSGCGTECIGSQGGHCCPHTSNPKVSVWCPSSMDCGGSRCRNLGCEWTDGVMCSYGGQDYLCSRGTTCSPGSLPPGCVICE